MSKLLVENYANFSNDFEQLKAKIINMCSQRELKTIMFTACNHKDGVTTTAKNLAFSLATDPSVKVLLIDLNPGKQKITSSNSDASDINQANDLSFLLDNVHKLLPKENTLLLNTILYWCQKIYSTVVPENLCVVTAKPGLVCSSSLVQSESFKTLLKLFKTQYDYVILDAPPVTSPGCLALGAQTDGVVLVLLSEQTRQEVAKNARAQLEDSGANLLGVVINKKKYYIPDFIYRRL